MPASNLHRHSPPALLLCALSLAATAQQAPPPTQQCQAESGPALVPVVELYTSEGCSSCPPADRWASALKPAAARGEVVVQAFHVGYWDYIGWIDRFAAPAHTQRQRQIAARTGSSTIYTPQVVNGGRDWRDWYRSAGPARPAEPARARIRLAGRGVDAFEAMVEPVAGHPGPWAAYWTVTEHGHASKVKAGENAGELLKHDFVVRQYVPVGDQKGAAALTLRAVAATPGHPRQVNLVVVEPATGRTLQALSLAC